MCEMCRFISWTLGLLRHWVGSGQERTKWSNRRPDPPPREPRRLGAGGRRRRRRPRCYLVAPLSCPVLSSLSVRPRPQQRDSADWSGQGEGIKDARKGRLRMEVPSPRSRTQHTFLVWKKERRRQRLTEQSPVAASKKSGGEGGQRGKEKRMRCAGGFGLPLLTQRPSGAAGGGVPRRGGPGSNRIGSGESWKTKKDR